MPELETRTDKVYAILTKLVQSTKDGKIRWTEVKDELGEVDYFETFDLYGGIVHIKRGYASKDYELSFHQGTTEIYSESIYLAGYGQNKKLKAFEEARELWKLAEISGSKPDRVLDSVLQSLEDIDKR